MRSNVCPKPWRPWSVTARRIIGYEEWRTPEPVRAKSCCAIESVGICASDLKCWLGAPLFWGNDGKSGYAQPPVIPGHEFVGNASWRLGEGAGEKYGLALGDLAVSEQIVPCWNCRFCQRGQYWMCPELAMSTASASAPLAPWPTMCCCPPARSTTRCQTPCRLPTPRLLSRLAVQSTQCSAATSNWATWS